MQRIPAGVIGASGYSGIELSRILATHPHVDLRALGSDRWKGDTAARRAGLFGAAGKLAYVAHDDAERFARECEVVFLATPAEASLELAPKLLDAGVRVVDLSGAFRLRDLAEFSSFYKLEHSAPELLKSAHYGIPELFSMPAGCRFVSNPGCYATAAALALAPLLEAGVLAPEGLVVDAASGTTGAGRKGSEEMSFAEVDEDFRAYKVLRHQHTPEIVQTLARASGSRVPLTFTPHLLPSRRGIVATCYGRLRKGAAPSDLKGALLHKYAKTPFVEVLGHPDEINLKDVVGTNRCTVSVACSEDGFDPGRVVVISALDNLVKGAAGQAVQNLNLMMGWPEAAGLDVLRGFHP